MEGRRIYSLTNKIFPIFRCLTGDGVRKTLDILSERIFEDTGLKMSVHEIPTDQKVFDWKVPKEWKIREAYIENEQGEHIIDICNNNLHVVGYSTSVNQWVSKDELMEYLYVDDNLQDAIPYVTSYYEERFGFCISKKQRDNLAEGKYHMVIDSELFDGYLTYGEVVVPGKNDKEVFFSTYICHPSMANNECSGPALATELIRYVSQLENRKYTYRFIFIPETIGSIAYMATNNHLDKMREKIIAGYTLTCVGDNNSYSMVNTRYGNTLPERVLRAVMKGNRTFKEYTYLDRGSDERQYNWPGIDLPIATFCRTKFFEYCEYHTSADDMGFVSEEGFQGSFDTMVACINVLEKNVICRVNVLCEPQMGRRGLYPTLSKKCNTIEVDTMMNIMAYMDGTNDLIDIAEITGVHIETVINITNILFDANLLTNLADREQT